MSLCKAVLTPNARTWHPCAGGPCKSTAKKDGYCGIHHPADRVRRLTPKRDRLKQQLDAVQIQLDEATTQLQQITTSADTTP